MKYILCLFFICQYYFAIAQVQETKNWCILNCERTGHDQKQLDLLYLQAKNDSIKNSMLDGNTNLRFPLRIGIVQSDTTQIEIPEIKVRQAIDQLNKSFEPTGFVFYIETVDVIFSKVTIEQLSQNAFNDYGTFSEKYDKEDIITIFIVNHGKDFCTTQGNTISCGRTGGFSYIFSDRANNIVLSRFDLLDQKIVAHEFGHFFGLYHTFEEGAFGKDQFKPEDCLLVGDRICDTPPDPGSFFEIYVNYSQCEMIGFKDKQGNEYKPLIENYMSYYKPCYLKAYSFTPQQIEIMQLAGMSAIRKKFAR